ncbi:helix-turn-helix domain-containing protein [Niallia sp. FSL W8-0635]|uniref:helix-turn-helix domain-containing protein n=1 Tax=Niallia sp. FSL W8-0635 TaxID=2975337 RepID=UPI0009C86F1A|nr:AraC family transcriptional regulator [Mycobacteroides abscessus subsp. abscessus]HEO8418590.1 helix-turn-helix transcriptional regulator [Yersinia enterocolitica]
MLYYQSNYFGQNGDFDRISAFNPTNLPHFHRSMELVMVDEGKLDLTIQNKTYTLHAGENALILSNQIHSLQSKQKNHSWIYVFSPELVNQFYQASKNKDLIHPIFQLQPTFCEMIKDVLTNNKSSMIAKKGVLYLICSELLNQTAFKEETRRDDYLLHDLLNYIQNHFTEELSLKDLSQKFGYDYSYLSRFFTKILKVPFVEFLNGHRVTLASQLLKTTDSKITEIADIVGYRNIRSFNRNFEKIMNTTPSNYRKIYMESY